MSRLALLALLAVAACSPTRSDLAPEAAYDAHHAALLDGDADRALSLLDEAADAGHLGALVQLARAHQRGYLVTPYDAERKAAAHLPIHATRWQTGRTLRRYERVLRDSVRVGSHDALFLLADRLVAPKPVDGEWAMPEADRDSAAAIYAALAAQGADPFRLAFLADRLGDEAAYLRHLDAATDAGNPQACALRVQHRRGRHAPFTAARLAEQIDALEACRARAPESDRGAYTYGDELVVDLAAQAGRGNAASVATLDSLRQRGVFERHPRLAAVVNPQEQQ